MSRVTLALPSVTCNKRDFNVLLFSTSRFRSVYSSVSLSPARATHPLSSLLSFSALRLYYGKRCRSR